MIKQSSAQNIGRAGERWFQSILPKEWLFQKPEEDIGLDGKIIIGTEHSTGGLEFGVQIKSSNKWQIKNGDISIDGIKIDTLLFWGSRPFPTMIVLYDVSNNIGYYGWAFDLLKQPIELAVPFVKQFNKKTLSMRMSARSVLEKDCFPRINTDVNNFYMTLSKTISPLRKSINILPAVNKLTEALRGLFFSLFQKPQNEDQIKITALMIVTSHQQVIRTLTELQNKYQIEAGCMNFIEYFIATYSGEVGKIIKDFDNYIDKDEPYTAMVNPKAHFTITPKLIDMIMDLILTLTDDKLKDRGTVFTFEQ